MQVIREDTEPQEPLHPEQKKRRNAKKDSLALSATSSSDINLEAVHLFSQVGSLAEVSRRLLIPIAQLSKMSREGWWQRELRGIQQEQTAMENLKLSRLWGLTLEQMDDYLSNGRVSIVRGKAVLDDAGDPIRNPLSPLELARFAEVLFNQRQLIRQLPTAINASESKLEEIADKLRVIGEARKAKLVEAEEIEVVSSSPAGPLPQPEDEDHDPGATRKRAVGLRGEDHVSTIRTGED